MRASVRRAPAGYEVCSVARSDPSGRAARALHDAREPVAGEPLAFAGEHALRVKLHALDVEADVAQAHDLALRRPSAHLEAVRERLSLDDERMVARGLERHAEAHEHGPLVVEDG